jgi:hypothetical protein
MARGSECYPRLILILLFPLFCDAWYFLEAWGAHGKHLVRSYKVPFFANLPSTTHPTFRSNISPTLKFEDLRRFQTGSSLSICIQRTDD